MPGPKQMVGGGEHQDVFDPLRFEEGRSKNKVFKGGGGTGFNPDSV